MAGVFICIPTYLKQCHADLLFKMPVLTRGKHTIGLGNVDSSAICFTMNSMWLDAIEAYKAGRIRYFMMWHTDIIPENYVVDKMVDLMERSEADILSAIVPLKNEMGLTSTAIDEPMGDADPYFRVKRYTMREVHNLPETFTHPKLLLNTGLMIVDLSKAWCQSDDVFFTIEDRIIRYRGRRLPVIWPEDWGFSRRARAAGAQKLVATRAVQLEHAGIANHPNYIPWGKLDVDVFPAIPAPEFRAAADEASKVDGYMLWEELAWLAEKAKGKEVLEIGSWLGRSTKALAATARKVWAVDHWKGTGNDLTGMQVQSGLDAYAAFQHNLAHEINQQRVIPVVSDHASMDQVAEADMIFIDGAHDEASVRRDMMLAMETIKPGGLICGHDYDEKAHPDVVKVVRELLPNASVAPDTTIWYVQMEPGTLPAYPGCCQEA